MKKRGSALVYVIAFASILIVLGTVVSSAVISTTKYNKEHSQIIDLELAAKSGLNIFLEELTKDINYAKNQKDISLLPLGISETNSSITDFDGINITKEITRDEVLEGEILRQYKYTIYSKAVKENGGSSFKEVSQVIIVNISGYGSEGDIVIAPINILNVRGDVELERAGLNYMDKIAYGGNISNGTYGFDKNKYPASSKIKDIDFSIDENNRNIYFENALFIPEKVQKSFDGLVEVSTEVMRESNIINKKYSIDDNVKVNKSITIEDSTIVINGNITFENSGKITINNSNLIVNNECYIVSGSEILIDNNSFVDISGNLNSSYGDIIIKIDDESILNIKKSLEKSDNNIKIDLKKNSKIDIGNRVYSKNKIEIDVEESRIITRNGGIIGTGGNEVNIDIESGFAYVAGAVQGNTCNIELDDDSYMYAGVILGGTYIELELEDSKMIINEKIESNTSANIDLDNSTLLCNDKVQIGTGFNLLNLKNSVFISGKEMKGHTQKVTMNNSALVAIGDENSKDGLSYTNQIEIVNLSNSFVYTLQNVKVPDLIISGNSNGITPSNNIMNIVKKILN